MSGTRRTIIKLTLIVLVVAVLTPAAASAGSLLSGYGGPGEGNQAILGSALLNGPSSKGGSGGSGGAAGAGRSGSYGSLIASADEGRAANSSHGSGGSTRSSSARSSKSGSKQRQVKAGAEKASNSASPPYTQTNRPSTQASSGGSSQPLGLSGADLLYILLALVVLALTGVLTRGLVRANVHGAGGPTQAMRRRTRLTN
ncbi:MAG: hypothetical protein ABR992_15430 [Solirubrobacteraceae bacterium]|jgi:hypothetical protein